MSEGQTGSQGYSLKKTVQAKISLFYDMRERERSGCSFELILYKHKAGERADWKKIKKKIMQKIEQV